MCCSFIFSMCFATRLQTEHVASVFYSVFLCSPSLSDSDWTAYRAPQGPRMRVLMEGGGGVTTVCPKQHRLKYMCVHFTEGECCESTDTTRHGG